jgi:hypothetical protein
MQPSLILMRRTAALVLLGASSLYASSPLDRLKKTPKTPEQLRAEYIARLQQQYVPAIEEGSLGCLWTARSVLGDFSSD